MTQLLTREAWKADRRSAIGASEWITALGFNPKKSRFMLAMEKLGRIEPDDLDLEEAIQYGHASEPVTLAMFARRTGRSVTPWPQNRFHRSSERPFLGATPDAIQLNGFRGMGTVQAKNVNAYLLKDWRGAPPLQTQVQIQAEMYVLDLRWSSLCATIGGNKLVYFDVDRDDRFISAALPALEEFWGYIRRGECPPTDPSESCSRALAMMYPEDNGNSITLPADFVKLDAELSALKRCQKALKDRRTAVENKIKEALGNNTEGELPNGNSLTWKQQTRKEHVVAESTFRVLRQHEGRGSTAENPEIFVATCTAALLAMGATLYHESDSGSRYFELAGGLLIRVSDHEANEKTEAWMERRDVFGIRVDQAGWRDQLETVTGPLLLEDEN